MNRHLTVDEIDLEGLILARNDGHPAGDWWFDPRTGRTLYHGLDDDSDLHELVEGVHVLVPHEPQPQTDVDDFFELAEALGVAEEDVVRLWDAYRRKGGLRRFREVVGRTGAAVAWADLTYRREVARAISWLRSRDLVDADDADRALVELAAAPGGIPLR